MNNLFDLSGKTALITGGGGLLGKKHAEAIIEYGGQVILGDYNHEKADKLANELNAKYGINSCKACFLDVVDVKSIHQLCESTEKIDILINNAAKNPKVTKNSSGEWFSLIQNNRFETMPREYWDQGLDVILTGNFLVSQIVINKMINQKIDKSDSGGVILNIASDLSVIAPDQRIYKKHPNESFEDQDVKPIFYSAAKWAIIGMTKYLATYFAEKNIRVNSLSPGGVFDNHPTDFVQKISNLIPMNRMANVDEYKGAVVFLCSDASSYMTGQNILIDGGRSSW
jgi:NAD(P)-dependent dehydrogenase (short-subunit alcohol dehydrogenase family)